MSASSASLQVEHLTVRYGGVNAVNDLSFEVRAGEIVGFIGPNGAGKTSAVDGLTGFTSSSGAVRLEGRDISSLAAHTRARLGLARTFQQLELCADLTVHDNIFVAARASRRGDAATVDAAMTRFGLESCRDELVSQLPQGTRRMAAVARAYATDPVVMLLDEPAAGLDVHEGDALSERLRLLAGEGRAILLIEHDMALVMQLCDRLIVLNFGNLLAEGLPDHVRSHPDVVTAYLGVESETAHA
jgi:ABC-type branched-subunit amino acid transport system ATPase component